MRAMVTNQNAGVVFVNNLDQKLAFRKRCRDGFFEQYRNVGPDARGRMLNVKLIGRGENNAIGPRLRNQFVKHFEQSHAPFGSDGLGGRRQIDNRRELAGGAVLQTINVRQANVACANNCDFHFIHC